VQRHARADPSRFFVGVDANAENMGDASRRALRGGLTNALFVQAAAEALPEELFGLASSLTVLLPWGSLLRAVAAGEVDGLARLCREGASLVVVFSDVEPEEGLIARYAAAGFHVSVRTISNREVGALGTSWAGRLGHGRPRRFFEIAGTRAR
jgi:16S rRNA (adenine(1408)-N(1))-methyltransferase